MSNQEDDSSVVGSNSSSSESKNEPLEEEIMETGPSEEEMMDKNSNCINQEDQHQQQQSSSSLSSNDSSPSKNIRDEMVSIESIRSIFKSAFPDLKLTEKGHIALTKAMELFIVKITNGIVEESKSTKIEYEDVVNCVHHSPIRAMYMLRDMLPIQVKYSQIKEQFLSDTDN